MSIRTLRIFHRSKRHITVFRSYCFLSPNFGSFLTSILLQNRQKNEGWTLWRYLRKKSHKAEKNLHKIILVMAGLEPMSFCLSDLEKAVVAKWQ